MLLIGWHNTRKDTSTLGVYTYQGGDWTREAQMSYESLNVDNYFGDGSTKSYSFVRQLHYYQLTLLMNGGRATFCLGRTSLSPT